TPASAISQVSRNTQGVTLMRLAKDERLQAIERLDASLDDDADGDDVVVSQDAPVTVPDSPTACPHPVNLRTPPHGAAFLFAADCPVSRSVRACVRPTTRGIRPAPRRTGAGRRRPRRTARTAWRGFPCRRSWRPAPGPGRG